MPELGLSFVIEWNYPVSIIYSGGYPLNFSFASNAGWHTYFWLSFLPLIVSMNFKQLNIYVNSEHTLFSFNDWGIPTFGAHLQLLLIVGTKLELISTRLAQEAADCPDEATGNPWTKPCKEHFWFSKPRIVLHLIHFILFQNSFEMGFFFWVLVCFTALHSFFSCTFNLSCRKYSYVFIWVSAILISIKLWC